ncbi:MAG: hypothetical protein ASARMPREDX12_006578 [Alectoria sarmentosa]|nr:MAG: hypothetical protein ASARMPREDX12_006578 [Alectoria sarmentosa]
MVVLDDNTVSRMLADKALHDQAFRDLLLEGVSPPFSTLYPVEKSKVFQVISQDIRTFRQQLVDNAGLKAPDLHGKPWDLNSYLNRAAYSRELEEKVDAQNEEETMAVSEEGGGEWGWVGLPICIARLAVAFLESTLRFQADPTPFPFERLPAELRVQVYREAVRGAVLDGFLHAKRITVTLTRGTNNSSPFRFGGLAKGESKEINFGLLTANKRVHEEAIPVLYQLRTFDFKTNVGGVILFLRSLPELARQNVRGITMELYNKAEPDHCCDENNNNSWGKGRDNQAAWSKACAYIAKDVNLKRLSLTINVKVPREFKSLKWVKDLVKIRGLKFLKLEAIQHHSSGPMVIRARYKESMLSATEHCMSEHLVPLFEYLCAEMLE